MTHPDIEEMELQGHLGEEPEVIALCRFCKLEIYTGETYYEVGDQWIFCAGCVTELEA